MKRVGIITLFGNYNYGNRLQNYAVQEILKQYGYDPETIDYYTDLKREIFRFLKRIVTKIKKDPSVSRFKSFSRFNKERIPTKRIYAKKGKMPSKIDDMYDFFVVGSDQVWNPEIRAEERSIFFLQFTKKSKRVCISPSIGVERIPDCWANVYKEGLLGFNFLCCREEVGCREIERITGRECTRLLDPTLAINADTWRRFALSKPVIISSKYILCFFLGTLSLEAKKQIFEFATKNDDIIIFCNERTSKYYSSDPRELLSLIIKADLVLTDSFHVAAFSINFNKDFWVFDRKDESKVANHINSRIKTLVNIFSLDNRYVENGFFPADFGVKCDYTFANSVIEKERKDFFNYMDVVINRLRFEEHEM